MIQNIINTTNKDILLFNPLLEVTFQPLKNNSHYIRQQPTH